MKGAHNVNELKGTLESLKPDMLVHVPQFFRISGNDDRVAFDQLLAKPGVIVVDPLEGQLTELIKAKNPSVRLTSDQLADAVQAHLGKLSVYEYGVWVYYPWTNRVVHILDEEEFVFVRTSRNQYKITPEERKTLEGKKIGVIGLSVGQSVSVTLAMERICGELRLADFDLLELTNLNRIRTGVHNLGLAKVYSVAREIAEIDPFIRIKCFPEGLTEVNMDRFFLEDGKLDLLVEESDGFDIKILSRYKARELRIPVIMEASDRCMVDIERFDLEPERSILHGIVDHLDVETLKSLQTNEEKIPYMLDVLGFETTTSRLRASMLEMQQTINTWPQLASAVTMGGGITADISRRILLGHYNGSGRFYVDIEDLIGDKNKQQEGFVKARVGADRQLTVEMMKGLVSTTKRLAESEAGYEALEKIVEAAVAAPSVGNRQPWRFYSQAGILHVFYNKASALPVTDPDHTNAYISLGAAIENISLAAGGQGLIADVGYFPAGEGTDLAASVRFTGGGKKDDLLDDVFKRQTIRNAGNANEISKEVLDLISREGGNMLQLTTNRSHIADFARIVGKLEKGRLLDAGSHDEIFGKIMRFGESRRERDGIEIRSMGFPPQMELAFQVISDPEVASWLRKWDKGAVFEKFFTSLFATSSAAGMVYANDGEPGSIIRCGRVVQRVWLTCTRHNLAFHPLCLPFNHLRQQNEPIYEQDIHSNISDLKALSAELSHIFNRMLTARGVFLFRLSHAEGIQPRSTRKPLNEVYYKSQETAR